MSAFYNLFTDGFNAVITGLRYALKWCNLYGFIFFGATFAVVKFTLYSVDLVLAQVPGLIAAYDEVGNAIGGEVGLFSSVLITVNTFIPLDLMLAYFALLLEFWALWNTYRFVKSWIPTVS